MIFGHDYFTAHCSSSTGIYTVSVMIFDEHLTTFAFPKTDDIFKNITFFIFKKDKQ